MLDQQGRLIDRLDKQLSIYRAEHETLWKEMQRLQSDHHRCFEENIRMRERLGITEEEAREVHAQVLADAHGTITSINTACCILFGYAHPEDLQGKQLEIIVPEKLRERHKAALARIVESGGMLNYRKRTIATWGLRKDGSEFAVSIDIEVIRQGDEWLFGATIRKRRGTAVSV